MGSPVTSEPILTNSNYIKSECGYWEDTFSYCILRNERDILIGVVTNCGLLKGMTGDTWVSWDYGDPENVQRVGFGGLVEMKEIIEGLLRL